MKNCKNLVASVTIPDGVTSIGYETFRGCSGLITVTIPDSVTSIGIGAFSDCSSLESVTIPDSVTFIGGCAFCSCKNLTTKKSAYKAFDLIKGKLKCIDYTFTENEWSNEVDNLELCKRGYHYCENLFEIFNYYFGELDKDMTIYECEVGDEVLHSDTSKCCTNRIKPVKRLYREDVIRILNGEM